MELSEVRSSMFGGLGRRIATTAAIIFALGLALTPYIQEVSSIQFERFIKVALSQVTT